MGLDLEIDQQRRDEIEGGQNRDNTTTGDEDLDRFRRREDPTDDLTDRERRQRWRRHASNYAERRIRQLATWAGLDNDVFYSEYRMLETVMFQRLASLGPHDGWVLTVTGKERIEEHIDQWLFYRWPELLAQREGDEDEGGGSGRGGGGIGRSFDIEALSRDVSKLWRLYLLQDAPDPRGIAQAFISLVQSNPTQDHDFENFILNRIEATDRYKMIAENKPAHLSYLENLRPYVDSASDVLGAGEGEQVANLAIAGAQFGATQQGFADRLQREDQVTGGSAYIQKLEGLLRQTRGVFRQ